MSLSILPTSTELATLGTLTDVVRWVGINTAIWDLTSRGFGTLPNMRVLACQPPESVLRVINGLRIPILRADGRPEMTQDESGADVPAHRGLTMVESIQVALVWRVCRQAFQMPDVDLYSPSYLAPASGSMGASPSAAALAPSPLGASKTGAKKIKVNQILDQMDDSELDILPQRQLDEAFQLFRSRMGSDPLKEHEPSPEQITAMYNKVVIQGDSPYADFSVLTPFGRRSQKQMKAKGFMLQEDGSWKQLEIPGPPSFEAWQACWQIYKTALLMLQYPSSGSTAASKEVMTWAALEEYHNRIFKLHKTYPECWHLLVAAEDRCRCEHLERTRRLLVRANLEGKVPLGMSFDEEQPWVGVFTYIARDLDFWTHEVILPSQNFLARGGAGKIMSKALADDLDIPGPAKDALENKKAGTARPYGLGESKAAKKRKRDREQIESLKAQSTSQTFQKGKSDGKGASQHPRKLGNQFVTSRDGVQICYAFAKGQPGSCPEPCANNRCHCCQICLGPHPNVSCPKAKDKGGKGSNK